MQNFIFHSPTKVFFGRGQIEALGPQAAALGRRALLVYGKASIKANGVYDAVVSQLRNQGIEFLELSGVDPNPRLGSVLEGARICREARLDFVLAVGGGSVIDCAKGIAAMARFEGEPWDFWRGKARLTGALPVAAVLTIAATGSEMNAGSVITNPDTGEKLGMSSLHLYPRFSILDPAFSFSVPDNQTAAGIADIMAHVFEFYFTVDSGAFLQDSFAEAILRTCAKYGPVAMERPDDYEARANLMWASSMALNGTVSAGKDFDGFGHLVEHAVSAAYDLTHGVGLAIIIPNWMDQVLGEGTLPRFARYARAVWDVAEADDLAAARAGIARTRAFFSSLGLPARLSEVGIGAGRFEEIIDNAVDPDGRLGNFVRLDRSGIRKVLEASL